MPVPVSGQTTSVDFYYIQQPDGNATPITAGTEIRLPDTAVGASSSGTVVVVNRSKDAVSINSVTLSGNSLALSGLPVLPASIDSGKDFRFTIRFAPLKRSQESEVVNVRYGSSTFTARITAKGVAATWKFALFAGAETLELTPQTSVSLPDVPTATRTRFDMEIGNVGDVSGRISSVSIQGTGWELSNVPVLPATLQPGEKTRIAIFVTAASPGPTSARIRIDDSAFDLTAVALGSALSFSYGDGSSSTPITSGGTVLFPTTSVGKSAALQLTIRSSGTADASVVSIGISGSEASFRILNLPSAAITLAPGQSLTLPVQFVPVSTGVQTTTVRINDVTLNLSGIGGAPVRLPDFEFQGISGNIGPAQQVPIGLHLSEPYAVSVSGTLTLSLDSALTNSDPAMLFSTGGVSVPFTIPAGTQDAIFPNGSNRVRFQTGTISGIVNLTPAFTATGSGTSLPGPSTRLQLTLASAAPRITSALVTDVSDTGFTLQISGYSTERKVSGLEFTFAAAPGAVLSTPSINVDVATAFDAWYGSSSSLQFGSSFTVSVPFTIRMSAAGTSGASRTVDSVAITAASPTGHSNQVTVGIR